MRSLTELVESEDPAWPEVEAAVAAAPYPIEILAVDPQRADEELLRAQVTTRSWLGAVVHRSGGLVLDHGWLRVLGSGNIEYHLASLGDINDGVANAFIVAQDVLGGQFAWTANAAGKPTVWYLAPDTLRWEDCGLGYGDWLAAMIGGGTTAYYQDLRWPEWVHESKACRLDHAINVSPRCGRQKARTSERRPAARCPCPRRCP